MEVVLNPHALKYLKRMNSPNQDRVTKALEGLAKNPPLGDICSLSGKNGYRLRVGSYRILFDIIEDKIVVHAIAPRGQVYKGGS